MAIGYLGLRYIELSISSPICNSSGAIVAILTLAVDGLGSIVALQLLAVGFVILGIVGLGITEATEDEDLRKARQQACNHRYTKSAIAIAIPIIYCLLDALGTFADSRVLLRLNEDSANTAYELTFLFTGICCAIYTLGIKKQKLVFRQEVPKYAGALCETAGQYAYIYALADEAHVALAAPIISAYCVLSVVWSRLILKEKLSFKHYAAIVIVVIGIVILGVFDA
jgi:drug/metabolite transporter (DMT)-like permease